MPPPSGGGCVAGLPKAARWVRREPREVGRELAWLTRSRRATEPPLLHLELEGNERVLLNRRAYGSPRTPRMVSALYLWRLSQSSIPPRLDVLGRSARGAFPRVFRTVAAVGFFARVFHSLFRGLRSKRGRARRSPELPRKAGLTSRKDGTARGWVRCCGCRRWGGRLGLYIALRAVCLREARAECPGERQRQYPLRKRT